MRESAVEKRLVDLVAGLGGIAYKFKSPNRRNVPDRIVVLPGHHIHFVECKAPGKKPRAAQQREFFRLAAFGFYVHVLDTIGKVDLFIEQRRSEK